MLNGTWRIYVDAPGTPDPDDKGHLPNGTLVTFELLGPTRLADEEERTDECSATMAIRFPDEVAPQARATTENNALPTGKVRRESGLQDVTFRVHIWTAEDVTRLENAALVAAGAGPGARLVTVMAPDGTEFEVWLHGRDTMLGACLVRGQGADVAHVAQHWTRA